MSTQENELSDGQERVGLKRKLTGPPRLLLGKSKSKEKFEGKSQRRQREAKPCDGTTDNKDQENNDGKANESSHNAHNSPQKTSEEMETQPVVPEDTTGIIVTLQESENKDENIARKVMTRSASKVSIKRTFSSLLSCGKMKDSNNKKDKAWNPKESKKNRNSAHDNVCENKLSEANNKEVFNGKWKKRAFFTLWPISKRSATFNVCVDRGCNEQGSGMDFQETAAQKGLAFKKIYRIFSRKKKAPPIDQFECSAASQNEVGDQLDQSSATVMDISSLKREENPEENLEAKAESVPEIFTFNVEVSVNTNIESCCTDEEQICPDQDVRMNKEETQELQNSGLMDSEVLPSNFSGCNIVSDLPGTSSGADLQVLNEKLIENNVRLRPVITIEHAYSSDEENVNESPQFDGLTVNGSWQHLKINGLTNNTLHPSDLHVLPEVDHSQCNESLLIQTAISMVQAAIRGAVEQLTIEQQHNQISLDHA